MNWSSSRQVPAVLGHVLDIPAHLEIHGGLQTGQQYLDAGQAAEAAQKFTVQQFVEITDGRRRTRHGLSRLGQAAANIVKYSQRTAKATFHKTHCRR